MPSDDCQQNILWAIKNGDLELVKELIEKSNIDVNQEVSSRHLVHYAADYGQVDVLAYLLLKGADVNSLDKHGISPILAAIWEGHTDCVELLLNKGASKHGTAPDGTTYIDAAEKADIKKLLC